MSKYTLREEWLTAARDLLKLQFFDPQERHLPPIIRVSIGLCGTKGVGMCVDPDCAEDGSTHIFIDPRMTDAIHVLGTLLHELIHASVGLECKHKGPFVVMFREMGFECKPTESAPTRETELYSTLEGIAARLGDYPHAALQRKKKEVKKSKWVPFVSKSNEDYIVRANFETIEEFGRPIDPFGEAMIYKNPEDAPQDEESLEEASDSDREP